MMLTAVRSLFDYHYTAYDRVWSSVMELSREQFVQEYNYSLGSVRNQLVHVMNVDDRWLSRLQHQQPTENLMFTDFPDAHSVRQKWTSIRARVQDYVFGLSREQLERTVELHFPGRGGRHHNTRWQICLHMVNHGTDHRAQILSLLQDLGGQTFEQDLILHLWSQEEPSGA
ncbi:MAG: DinB family protein [Chloroflexi bacterium]|nr:DinB family protein [Chloroflexota bacterium]